MHRRSPRQDGCGVAPIRRAPGPDNGRGFIVRIVQIVRTVRTAGNRRHSVRTMVVRGRRGIVRDRPQPTRENAGETPFADGLDDADDESRPLSGRGARQIGATPRPSCRGERRCIGRPPVRRGLDHVPDLPHPSTTLPPGPLPGNCPIVLLSCPGSRRQAGHVIPGQSAPANKTAGISFITTCGSCHDEGGRRARTLRSPHPHRNLAGRLAAA